jgi:hypothetical protein
MTKWNTAVGDTFISNASLDGKYPLSSSIFEALYNGRRNRETTSAHLIHFTRRTRQCPTCLVRNFQPILPCGSRTSFSYERWKAEHIKPYLSDIAVGTKHLDKILLQYANSLVAHGIQREPDELETEICSSLFPTLFDSTVPCNHYLFLHPPF